MIFIVTQFFLATGWRSRAIAAMVEAAAMWAQGVLHFEEMIGHVDFNALALLFGTMVLVGVFREANFFTIVEVRLGNLVSCRVNLLFILLLFVTAILPAFVI